ncbi:MAG: flagellar biosynthesis protein FlhA [Clostridiales bacterium]|jgi:flagellar biosynthesis protein FlhA|nr:flagellar biosynthesis protein FlhA [Clostridiales bacterium]
MNLTNFRGLSAVKKCILGVLVIGIVAVIVIPPSPAAMDFLLMVSMFIGIIILLNAIYSEKPTDMSLFPTILLISTLYRLVLNISSTRLILSTGNAGEVIRTFGEFVAGGNMVVGGIVFIIIVIVNLMVITKGSTRVSEVTARFTLDAMPGKQMAIDADLNTGLIDEAEAKARRAQIQNEANFYGAMDGASKFVSGDAIAGIVITFVNLLGGIVLGATGIATGTPLPLAEAARLYTLMTIGDGLVSQIPAILISVATGILVTKANANPDEDVTTELSRQLFGKTLVLYIAGPVLIVFGVFTALPKVLFISAGLVVLAYANFADRRQKIAAIETDITHEDSEVSEIRRPENVISLLSVDPILLIFGYGLIPLVDAAQGGDLLDRVVMIRRQIALELGAVVPIIRLRDDIKLAPNEYRILIKGVEVAGGDIMFDHYMAMNPGYVEDEIEGIETVEPYLGLPALWISESQRERAETLGYTVVDPPAIIATHLTEVVRSHLHELLSRQDTQSLVSNVKDANSVLIDELIPKLMSIGDVQKVLANLLREGISIRDLVTILETLADYAHVTRDTDMLTEYVRQALRRSLSKQYFEHGSNTVITLDPDLEQRIMSSVQQTEQGSFLALDPGVTQKIFNNLNAEVSKLTSMGLQPIILTSPIVRVYFKRLVEQVAPDLIVLSYNEIDSSVEVQSIGVVSA